MDRLWVKADGRGWISVRFFSCGQKERAKCPRLGQRPYDRIGYRRARRAIWGILRWLLGDASDMATLTATARSGVR